MKADLPMFIPGMGAYVRWYHEGVSREDIAAIALAGPLFGLTVALGFLAAWIELHSRDLHRAGVCDGMDQLREPDTGVRVWMEPMRPLR